MLYSIKGDANHLLMPLELSVIQRYGKAAYVECYNFMVFPVFSIISICDLEDHEIFNNIGKES